MPTAWQGGGRWRIIETMDAALEEALKLSVDARLELIEMLWNSIVDERGEGFEVTAAERDELERRLLAHEADPDAAVPWDEVKARLGLADRR